MKNCLQFFPFLPSFLKVVSTSKEVINIKFQHLNKESHELSQRMLIKSGSSDRPGPK